MKLIEPSATVDHFSAIGKSFATIEFFAKTLENYDYVFSHEFPSGHLKNGGINELRAVSSKLILFPAITFQAFHPDLIYLLDETQNYAQLHGPLGPYQSALGVFAYRKGLSLEQANALFNHNVFEAVGYLNMWDSAANELINYAKENFAMDLSFELLTWARRGVFMYSSVHPKGYVLYDIAKKLFAKVGLRVRELDFEYYAIHDLARSDFPDLSAHRRKLGRAGKLSVQITEPPSFRGSRRLSQPAAISCCLLQDLPRQQAIQDEASSRRRLVVGQGDRRNARAAGAGKSARGASADVVTPD